MERNHFSISDDSQSLGSGNSGSSGQRRASSTGGHASGDYNRAPLVITWEITQACDLSCDHCRAEASPKRSRKELTTAEGIELFEQVTEFDPQPFVVLSGGDPLKRPDLSELLFGAVERGLTPSVTPATTPALDRETVERFADIGIGRMALSLDGATPDSHDSFRGEPGTFEVAVNAAKNARELDVPIQINTTVTASTVDELADIAVWVRDLGAVMWEVFFLVPVGRGTDLEQLKPGEAYDVMKWLYQLDKRVPYRIITVEAPFYRRVAHEAQNRNNEKNHPVGSTGAGNGFIFVSHTGEVYPSGFMPLSVGNVLEQPLVEIYQHAPLLKRLRETRTLTGPCGKCSFASRCGGSRSRALAISGNPFTSDQLCPWVRESQE